MNIELLQIAQMVELAIWVKVSAFKMSPEEAKRRIWWVRVCLAGTVTIYLGVNIFKASNLHFIFVNFDLYLNGEVSEKRLIIAKTFTPANYFSIATGLVISAI